MTTTGVALNRAHRQPCPLRNLGMGQALKCTQRHHDTLIFGELIQRVGHEHAASDARQRSILRRRLDRGIQIGFGPSLHTAYVID